MGKLPYRVSTKFSYNFNVNLWLILVHVIKNCIKYQILIGTIYPHFLKISFRLIKVGLSYSLKRDPRPFSEFTQFWTILSLTASKNAFLRLLLIVLKFNLDWKVKLSPIECCLSMAASKMHFWRLSMIKWCKTL